YTLTYTADGQQVTKPVTLVEGENSLDVVECDLAGNETKTSLKVTLDTVPPTLAATSATYTQSASYNLTYTIDGVSAQRVVPLQEGENIIPIIERDAAGNESQIEFLVYFAPDLPAFAQTLPPSPAQPVKIQTDVPGLLAVSLADGSEILYENGNIHHIELADKTVIQNVTLDADGKIKDAELFLSDGRKQIVRDGAVLYEFAANGLFTEYAADGSVKRVGESEYYYGADHTWIATADTIARYNAAGKLAAVIQNDETIRIFDSGIPTKTFKPNDGIKMVDTSNLVFDQDHNVISSTNPDGTRFEFANGLPATVTAADGTVTQFAFNNLAVSVMRDSVTSNYAASGKLTQVVTDQGTFNIENDKIKTLELKDGSKILSIDLDEAGNILKATILDPDGTYRTFENGVLIRVLQPNGDIWIYANGRPEKLTTSLNFQYQFSYEPNQIKADLINVDIANADTPIQLVYDPNFYRSVQLHARCRGQSCQNPDQSG
ncbi:MAG: hypothetical protein HZC17_08050, partial [Candidatus Omnitrophica bacterium]|nr:hypothetical protein [Candidatus Omnitrophota bacterium]